MIDVSPVIPASFASGFILSILKSLRVREAII
jgi:hypothetical protein